MHRDMKAKSKETNKRKTSPTFSAVQRIRAAQTQLPRSPLLHGLHSDVTFILDPSVAKQILSQHELKPKGKDDDSREDDDDSTYADLYKPTKPTKLLQFALTNANGEAWERQRFCVSRAFAVGKTFRDSCARYAMQRTMKLAQEYAHIHESNITRHRSSSTCSSACCCRGWMSRLKIWTKVQKTKGVDARYIAKEIAVYTMVHAVLGTGMHSCDGGDTNAMPALLKNVIDSLKEMVSDTLEPHRDENSSKSTLKIVERLDQSVKKAFEVVLLGNMPGKGENENDCLAGRLLQYERSAKDGCARPTSIAGDNGKDVDDDDKVEQCEYYLTREEIISNCHSALLAGTQTMCTTLVSALAHLAERKDIQSQWRSDTIDDHQSIKDSDSDEKESKSSTAISCAPITARDAINESMRILPPVAGLPRVPTKCNLNIHQQTRTSLQPNLIARTTTEDGNKMIDSQCGYDSCTTHTIGRSQMMIVDLLAISHAKPPHVKKNRDIPQHGTISTSTLKFDPSHKSRSKSQAQPWGIGRRKCPAGIITMECLTSVIDTLVREGITWELADPKRDSVGKDGCGGWMESISYRPTISFGRSICIYFEREERERIIAQE